MRELLLVFRQAGGAVRLLRNRSTWFWLFMLFFWWLALPVLLVWKMPAFTFGVVAPLVLWLVLDQPAAALALAVGVLVAVPVVRITRGGGDGPLAPPPSE